MAGDGFGYPPAPAILRCSLFTTRSCIFHGLPSASDALNVKLFESRTYALNSLMSTLLSMSVQ